MVQNDSARGHCGAIDGRSIPIASMRAGATDDLGADEPRRAMSERTWPAATCAGVPRGTDQARHSYSPTVNKVTYSSKSELARMTRSRLDSQMPNAARN